jgi:hypothetical protein
MNKNYPMGKCLPDRSGFTLISMAIVLVIIGLLAGGVLVGKDLIRNAALRADIATISKYISAMNEFQMKYDCIAGDCLKASSFGLGTNGNGDGVISNYYFDAALGVLIPESVDIWQHMSRAGLIEGAYDGDVNAANNLKCTASTCPQSKLYTSDALYFAANNEVLAYIGTAPVYGQKITADSSTLGVFWLNRSGDLKSHVGVFDARDLDVKLDDGDSDSGRFLTINDNFAVGNCIAGRYDVTDGSANYNMADTANDCFPFYLVF